MGKQFDYGGTVGLLKASLFAYNLIYWMFGIVVTAVGLWLEFHMHRYFEMSQDYSGTATHLLIGCGFLIIMITSVGFSCIYKGNVMMLYMYAAFMGCMIIMTCGIDLSIICFWENFRPSLYHGLTKSITTGDKEHCNFDFAQRTFQCCGVNNYTDWILWSPQKVIPTSCCIDPYNCVTANYSDLYQIGCFKIIDEFVNQNMVYLVGTGFAAGVMPCLGALLTSSLISQIRKQHPLIY